MTEVKTELCDPDFELRHRLKREKMLPYERAYRLKNREKRIEYVRNYRKGIRIRGAYQTCLPGTNGRKAYSLESRIAHFWSACDVRSDSECWNWKASVCSQTGYGQFCYNGLEMNASRFAYWISHLKAKTPIPKGMLVCHRCDNRRCCNPGHLFLGTYKDNAQDAVKKGRAVPPPVRANITPDDVRFIRSIWVPYKMSVRKISNRYGFPYKSVECAVSKRKWKSVK